MISSIDTEIEIGVDAEEKFIENVQIVELRKARMISVSIDEIIKKRLLIYLSLIHI